MTEAEAYKIAASCLRHFDGHGLAAEGQRAADSIVGAIGAALRERDAAWRTAVREADSCASDDGAYGLHLEVFGDTYTKCGCVPIRALLEEAGK